MRIFTKTEKQQIALGNMKLLKEYLNVHLEDTKEQLLMYKKDNTEYDNVLKGKGIFLKDFLELLGN